MQTAYSCFNAQLYNSFTMYAEHYQDLATAHLATVNSLPVGRATYCCSWSHTYEVNWVYKTYMVRPPATYGWFHEAFQRSSYYGVASFTCNYTHCDPRENTLCRLQLRILLYSYSRSQLYVIHEAHAHEVHKPYIPCPKLDTRSLLYIRTYIAIAMISWSQLHWKNAE